MKKKKTLDPPSHFVVSIGNVRVLLCQWCDALFHRLWSRRCGVRPCALTRHMITWLAGSFRIWKRRKTKNPKKHSYYFRCHPSRGATWQAGVTTARCGGRRFFFFFAFLKLLGIPWFECVCVCVVVVLLPVAWLEEREAVGSARSGAGDSVQFFNLLFCYLF